MVWILEHKAGRRQDMAHAPVRSHQAPQNLQQGRLPASVWPDQHVQGAPRDLKTDVRKDLQVKLQLYTSVCTTPCDIQGLSCIEPIGCVRHMKL